MLKALFLDFDGVIADTYEICYNLEKELEPNLTDKEFRSKYIGNYWDKVDKIKFTKDIEKKYQKKYKDKLSLLTIKEDIRNLLKELIKTYKLFIISSGSEDSIKGFLKNNDLIIFFTGVLGKETNYSKVEKFNLVLKQYDLDSNNALFITDTLGDIIEANEVNIKPIAVTWGFHCRETLLKGKPYKIADTISELRNFIVL